MLGEHERESERVGASRARMGDSEVTQVTSDRVIVTDHSDRIMVTTYRDGDKLACVEQSPLQSLMIAERLLDAALRRLIVDRETRAKFL
jgi:hypothetical protein